MRQSAKVVAVSGNKATVQFTRSKACAHCGGCIQLGSDQAIIEVGNPLNAKVGEGVVLELHAKGFLQATLWAYIMPLCLLILGVYLGSRLSDALGAVLGLAGAGLGYLILKLLEPRFSRMPKFRPKMIGFDDETEEPPAAQGAGDEE